jgi:hypothetical protein
MRTLGQCLPRSSLYVREIGVLIYTMDQLYTTYAIFLVYGWCSVLVLLPCHSKMCKINVHLHVKTYYTVDQGVKGLVSPHAFFNE